MTDQNVNIRINIQTALIEDEVHSHIKTIKETYISLCKELSSYKELSELPDNEFSYSHEEAMTLKTNLHTKFDTINHLINILKSTDITSSSLEVFFIFIFIFTYRKKSIMYLTLWIKINLVINMMNIFPYLIKQIVNYLNFHR